MNLLVGAGCYAVAFAFLARQHGLRRNFYFYTSLGLMLVLVEHSRSCSRTGDGAGVDGARRADDLAARCGPSA